MVKNKTYTILIISILILLLQSCTFNNNTMQYIGINSNNIYPNNIIYNYLVDDIKKGYKINTIPPNRNYDDLIILLGSYNILELKILIQQETTLKRTKTLQVKISNYNIYNEKIITVDYYE